tara:strand:+ start:463 stop:882 length:420 start_codon:yes stop_codon:yes gene_type:complete
MLYSVYKITGNKGKLNYIGHTRNINKRIQKHKQNSIQYPNRLISQIFKYDNTYEILINCETDYESIRKIENAFIEINKTKGINCNMRKSYINNEDRLIRQKTLMREKRKTIEYKTLEKENRKRIYHFNKEMDYLNRIKI